MNLVERLVSSIKREQKCIIFIGDAMDDVWVDGSVQRCQDWCPKFVIEHHCEVPGGAANAEHCLQHWGVRTLLYSYGKDDWPTKTRFCVDGKIVYRLDDETRSKEKLRLVPWMYDMALDMVPHAAAVLLSDYDKGFLTPDFIGQVSILCQKHGIPCVADCKREPSTYPSCVLKGNESYWQRYSAPIGVDIVMTRGAGTPFMTRTDLMADLSSVECINHVGAGDCFAAHLTLALAYGFTLPDAAALAHSAGRVYVQHRYNRAPWPREVWEDVEK